MFDSLSLRLGRDFYPVDATLELTTRCNASCSYCYLRQRDQSDPTSTNDWCRIIDKLADAGVLSLCITGGEPFVRGDILSILEHCIARGFFYTAINTNGTLINEQHLSFLADHHDYFSHIQFSIFSHLADVHDGYIGVPGGLARCLEHADRVKRIGIPVRIALNVIHENVEHFEQTRELLLGRGFVVYPSFFRLVSDSAHNRELQPCMSRDFFDRALSCSNRTMVAGVVQGFHDRLRSDNVELCRGRFTGILVDSAGDVCPCTALRQIKIGRLLGPLSLRELLRDSSEYLRLRSLKKTDIEECAECAYRSYCSICVGCACAESGERLGPQRQKCNYAQAVAALACGSVPISG